eukprot:751362-Hanusia_phi.AAC.8
MSGCLGMQTMNLDYNDVIFEYIHDLIVVGRGGGLVLLEQKTTTRHGVHMAKELKKEDRREPAGIKRGQENWPTNFEITTRIDLKCQLRLRGQAPALPEPLNRANRTNSLLENIFLGPTA